MNFIPLLCNDILNIVYQYLATCSRTKSIELYTKMINYNELYRLWIKTIEKQIVRYQNIMKMCQLKKGCIRSYSNAKRSDVLLRSIINSL